MGETQEIILQTLLNGDNLNILFTEKIMELDSFNQILILEGTFMFFYILVMFTITLFKITSLR